MNPSRLASLGAVAGRILPDGRELCVIPRLYNTILTVGPPGNGCYDQHW